MSVMPYLAFADECADAIQLYRTAFEAETLEIFTFGESAEQGAMQIPAGTEARIMQAMLNICGGHVSMSDNFGTEAVSVGERVSIAVEAERTIVERAYSLLSREGT